MTDTDQANGGSRQMYQGSWACSGCSSEITELPFKPTPGRDSNLKCRDCFRNSRSEGTGNAPRQMYQGDWQCGSCGGAIKELPFEPDPARLSQITCRDCHRKKNNLQ